MAEEQRIVVDYISGRDLITIDFYSKVTGQKFHEISISASEAHFLAQVLELAVRRVYADLI